MKKFCLLFCFAMGVKFCAMAQGSRSVIDFDKGWSFNLGDVEKADANSFDDSKWRKLDLPHDWSIEGEFSKNNPATPEGGALPGGIGWYRKTFTVSAADKNKQVFIDFDGVYQKSTVWINGHKLGFRPNGYISFRYELTPFLHFGSSNIIAVKVDNSVQPNSRWYSGSGIYRNVWLVKTQRTAITHWGTYVTTPKINNNIAAVNLQVTIDRLEKGLPGNLISTVYNAEGKVVATKASLNVLPESGLKTITQDFTLEKPILWSVEKPYLYKIVSRLFVKGNQIDEYVTPLGIRYFNFDVDKGFSLNGKPMKILGVCDHHDLGALGAAVNYRALQRQLEILKTMGCNGIRTSHNPPSPELLDLCDKMGFIVMDEAFDCWEKGKVKYDYSLYFKEWHKQDLEDQILRDRNHPSVMIWSIGNEIPQQGDTSALRIAPELAAIVHNLDKTRPITTANDRPDTRNQIIRSGALDLIGYNYHEYDYATFHDRYPGKKFIATETTSGLETRGFYQMPSDTIYRWPTKDGKGMNADNTVSAYDNVAPSWGSTHEKTWKVMKKYDFLSGMFIWTGFDYLGEPTPYSWPSRSSYFGILDLAGFPKDIFYMYQSEWTNTPVLHLLPHWNWQTGKTVDVWAFYNQADEVELYLNGKSVGIKKKNGDDLHVMWRLKFEPGTLKAVSRKDGKVVMTSVIKTAGAPAKIELTADRQEINADGKDLAYITARVLDQEGNVVPDAENEISFAINGNAYVRATDNGDPVSHQSFQSKNRKVFHGLALAILQAKQTRGRVILTATAQGLRSAAIQIMVR
jgi:beta-galactosidase